MPNRRTRDRQLAKLAARRAAERHRKRRQRILAASVAGAVALGGIGFGLVTLLSGRSSPSAAPSPRASATTTPAAGPVACGGTVPKAASKKKPFFKKAPKKSIDPKKTYTLKMVTTCGTIEMKLDQKSAPNTVNSLVFLTRQHFYDGLQIDRIAQGFVIQGGDPRSAAGNPPPTDRNTGPGYTTVDPPPKGARYPEGTVAMAKSGSDPSGAGGSSFFIVTGAGADDSLAPGGTGQYAIVGHVTKGLEVALKIDQMPRQGGVPDGPPLERIYLIKVTVEVS